MKLADRSTDGGPMRLRHGEGRPATVGACLDSVDRRAPTLTPRARTATIQNLAGARVEVAEVSPPPLLESWRFETGSGIAGLETLYARVDGHRQIAALRSW